MLRAQFSERLVGFLAVGAATCEVILAVDGVFSGAKMATLVEFMSFQRVEPRKADTVHEQGDCDHDAQNLQDIEAAVGARKYGKGELHS